MLPQPIRPPALNGNHVAPPTAGGAFASPPAQTVFPRTRLLLAPATLLYTLSRGQIGGVVPWRILQWLLLLAAGSWATGALPGRWWGVGFWLLLLVVLQSTLWSLRHHDFVSFQPGLLPSIKPQALDPKLKLPVFASGHFAVENKQARFTWLPGFYRTFATREHALLCQVSDPPALGLARWPASEVGLWYLFFDPAALEEVQWGLLSFGRNQQPALAIRYRYTPARVRGRRPPPAQTETVYLAFEQETDGRAILADLLYDGPITASAPVTRNAS